MIPQLELDREHTNANDRGSCGKKRRIAWSARQRNCRDELSALGIQARSQTRAELCRRNYGLETARCHERTAHTRVERGTFSAGEQMLAHGLLVNTGEGVVYERYVALSKGATVHTEGRR